ncbi:MAG TPA: triple tyrosine motif-containing protein, partial [Thermoanaerobaculia bacterium]|nr:triple tyrosine motif-containing protein [Thermoanaerobaculia bacterium]
PAGQRAFGQVLRTAATDKGFVFITTRWLFLWDGARMNTVATFPGDRPYAAIFPVDDAVFAWTRAGIMRLAGTKLEPVPGGEVFRNRRADLILPADGGGLLVSVRGEGLFLLKDGLAQPFAARASRWTAEKRLLAGVRLADGRWALGSILGGVLLLRPDGTVDQVIDTSVGLRDNFVSGAMVDREGSLWLALNNGIARVEIASPLSIINRRAGLEGTVYTVARHLGKLWVGTAAGLFTTAGSERAAGEPKVPEWGGLPVRIRAVPGLPPSVWSLLSVDQDLLVGTAFGPYLLRGTSAQALAGARQSTVYVLARSRRDPDRVWLGTADGLGAIRREGAGWRFEGMVPGMTSEVRSIEEGENGVLWCATEINGLWRVELDADTLERPARLRQIPGGADARLNRIGGRILAATGEKVLRLDEAKGRLEDDPALAGMRGRLSLVAEDTAGNVWMNSHPPAVALRQGTGWTAKARSLVEVPGHVLVTIVAEPDGVVWLGGDEGLYRYAGAFHDQGSALPAPPLAQVTSSGDKLLFGGAPGVTPKAIDLPPYLRRLRIEFAPLSFRAGLRFQTRLEPIDAGWSGPTAEPFAELTRLPPGPYTFHVRTSGPNGEVGPATSWSFRVLHPWYETSWAIAGWIALAIAALTGYVRLRSRALRQRAAR